MELLVFVVQSGLQGTEEAPFDALHQYIHLFLLHLQPDPLYAAWMWAWSWALGGRVGLAVKGGSIKNTYFVLQCISFFFFFPEDENKEISWNHLNPP